MEQQKTVLGNNPYLELDNQGHIEYRELTKAQHRLGRDPARSDLLVPNNWQIVSGCHAILRKLGDDYEIYDGDGRKPSTNGLFIDRTRITPTESCKLRSGSQLHIGLDPRQLIHVKYINPASLSRVSLPAERSISLKNRSVTLGRDRNTTVTLDAPTVSRHHATVKPQGKGNYLLEDCSTNGIFVNGKRVKGSILLPENAKIQIGPFTLLRLGDNLEVTDRGHQIRLDARELIREVKDQQGKTRRLIDNISLAIEPGQLVALVGGSGAGKSTLMRTLLGIEPISSGNVFLNGDDLRCNFNIYRSQIGYVPQDDIIHRQLTVCEVLTYAAKLRLPPDTDVKQVVQQTLDEIEMSGYRNVLVSKISGGQRKRVSIGVELLSDPKLFFLDEPTSGLDPGLDRKMMQLLAKLTQQGRTVILVTHAPANINLCDRLVFLGRGGRLCYFGPPQATLNFFSVGDFTDIYDILEQGEETVKQWAAYFRQSEDCQQYVENHLGPGDRTALSKASKPKGMPPIPQLSLLANRYLKLTQRDPINIGLGLFTSIICPGLIALVMTDKDPLILGSEKDRELYGLALRVLFVITCAAIWVGLSSSLQEIVKESAIYLRERLVNLRLFSYLGSKVTVLTGLALLQALLMTWVILAGFEDPPSDLIPWPLGLGVTTVLTLLASMSLGLMVSATVKNSAQANSALPLLLVPQIIFSGVLFKLEGITSKISWLMLSRWSVGAYGALVDVNRMIVGPQELPDGSIIEPLFEATSVYDPSWANLGLNWGMLGLHGTIYLAIAFFLQKRKDVF